MMKSPMEEIKSKKRLLLKKYLEKNNRNNSTLFTQNQDAMLALDLGGNIVQANAAFEKLTGYSDEYYTSMTFLTLIAVESLDKVLNHFQKSASGIFENYDCKIKNVFGEVLDVNITNIPISVEDQLIGIYIVARDITPFKRKREESRKIEEFHHLLTENIQDLIISTSLLGEIHYSSPSSQQVLGYSPDELVGQHLSMIVYEEDIEKAFLDRGNMLINLKNNRGSYRFLKKDGNFIWIESICTPIVDPVTKNVLEVVSVIRDITERKKAEEELWARKRAFRNLVEHSPDAVIIAKNEEIIFINETGVNLLGASSAEEILSRSLLEFIHPDYHELANNRMEAVINGEVVDFVEYKIKKSDGSIMDAEMTGMPTYFDHQTAQHIIARDITEKKKTQELMIHSEKLSVAGQLAAGIAHEVRNPLTAIKGFLQISKEQIENQYYDIVISELERIELILSELLILAKPQAIIFKKENIISLMDDVKMLIDTQAIMNNIQIKFVNEIEDLTIRCDKNQLKQVFINFLKNAIEAMPNGGSITIDIKQICTEKVKILIKDTGTGIPYPILKRLGEPFLTTKEAGTGLGIMISKQIIENHKGTLHFWSDAQGTIIEVNLPIF